MRIYDAMAWHTKLKDARKTRGYSQESLAATLGIAQTTVSRWEKGGMPELATLLQLRDLLDLSLDWLLDDERTESYFAESEFRRLMRDIGGIEVARRRIIDAGRAPSLGEPNKLK